MAVTLVFLGKLADLTGAAEREVAAPLDWIAYTWLGIAFYAFLALLALEPIRLAARLWLRGSRNEATDVVPGGARRAPRRRDETTQRGRGRAPGSGAVRQDDLHAEDVIG